MPSMKSIRILLADDHSLLRMGLSALLGHQPGLQVVGEVANGKEAVEATGRLRPDVVVMDLMMPVLDGVEATRRIRAAAPSVCVLILTSFGTSTDLARAVEAGASGAVVKDAPNDELLAAIRTVAAGGTHFSPEIRQTVDETKRTILSPRQLEILNAVMRGFTNRDIANQLGVSSDCVKQHLNAVFQKIGAANRTEAVSIALRKQLLKI